VAPGGEAVGTLGVRGDYYGEGGTLELQSSWAATPRRPTG
jgi:hypothetical protein